MRKEQQKKDWQKMFDELNDPDKLAEARRKYQIKKYLSDNKKDTGMV